MGGIEKLSTMLDFIRVKILRIIFIVDIALLLLKRTQTFSCFVKRSLVKFWCAKGRFKK